MKNLCVVLKYGDRFLSPRKWEEAVGIAPSEVWVYGVAFTDPERKLMEAVRAAITFSKPTVHFIY